MRTALISLFAAIFLCACGILSTEKEPEKTAERVVVPTFCADSAYHFVEQQVNFGPRVPQSVAHERCANYFLEQFARFGAETAVQEGKMERFDGKIMPVKNIIASFNKEKKRRILLAAHWDCRPFSDNDSDPKNWNKPIDGASDGASGCGVLMELARQFSLTEPTVGIDIVLFDLEDSGTPEFYPNQNKPNTWCLGSQLWAKTPHEKNYNAEFGILLDMVGAKNAKFLKETFSVNFANHWVEKVWNTASQLGFGNFFIDAQGGYITDDHLYINELAHIPTIDIVQFDPSETGFADYWHTQNDTMKNIDKKTLFAVGQTLMDVIYN